MAPHREVVALGTRRLVEEIPMSNATPVSPLAERGRCFLVYNYTALIKITMETLSLLRNKEGLLLRNRFEQQFSQFEKIPFENTEFEAIDIRPPEQRDDVPVLFVPGYGKSPRSYKELLFELFKAGRRVISMTAPVEDIKLQPYEKGKVPSAQVIRALAINHLIGAKEINRVDVVSHSEGCTNATIAERIEPEKFRYFVYITPPGVTEKQGWPTIGKRSIQNLMDINRAIKNETPEIAIKFQHSKDEAKVFGRKRGAIKALYESGLLGRFSIADEVRALHNEGHGVVIIAGTGDKMLPMREYQRTKEGAARSAESLGVDGFIQHPGGHGAAHVNKNYGALAAIMLESLKKKYKKEQN